MEHSFKLLTLLAILPSIIHAQNRIKIGVQAGINYVNNVIVEDNLHRQDDQREFRFGYHFGLTGKIEITDKFSTSIETLLSSSGYHFKGYQTSDPPGDGNVHYTYLSIPIFAELTPIPKLKIQAGPQLGYLLSAKTKFESETVNLFDFWENLGIETSLNRFELGIGVGTEFSLTEKLLLGFRYFHGVSSLFDWDVVLVDEQGNPMDTPNFKEQNRTLQLSFAYLIW